jgi:hypothetical protein
MKKLLSLALLLFSSAALAQIGGFGSGVGGVPSTINCTGGFCSRACAANYTRSGPNFCLWTGPTGSAVTTAINTTCTAQPVADANAVAVLVKVHFTGKTTNAAGTQHTLNFLGYNDSTCTTAIHLTVFTHWEYAAVAATTVVQEQNFLTVLPNVAGNVRAQMGQSDVQQSVDIRAIGYFD